MAGEASAAVATEVDEQTAEVALALLGHIEEQINRSDTKAQVVLAADAILLGWFGTLNSTVLQTLLAGDVSAAVRATSLFAALVFVALFLSLASGLVVILPRAATPGQSSLVYFAAIARRREAEFVATFLGQSRTAITQSVLAGVHAEARIAQRKFRWVSMSVAFLLVTMVLVAALGLAQVTLP